MIKIIATNKKAYHDYFIEDTFEAGIALAGSEVKSLRKGGINLKDSYAQIKRGELFLVNAHISPFEKTGNFAPDVRRDRKLLMHKSEIAKLIGKVNEKGYTLVATKIYFKKALVKVELGLAKGKELHDKRASLKEKQSKREIARIIKEINYEH